MTPGAVGIAGLVRDLLVEFGLRSRGAATAAGDELGEWLAVPWADWRSDPTRGSSLTESGAPFELSIKLDAGQGLSLRYVIDVADHRLDLTGNADRYRRVADRMTEIDSADLFDRHLSLVLPGSEPRVMLGAAFADGGRRRSTVYFPASGLDEAQRTALLPPRAASIADEDRGIVGDGVEVVGYDVVQGLVAACKTYRWLTVGPQVGLPVLIGGPDAGMSAAALIHREFVGDVPAALRSRATFVQRTIPLEGSGPSGGSLSAAADPVSEKLFFFSRGWGWSSGPGLGRLLTLLAGQLGVDLRPLLSIRESARRCGLPLHIGLVSVGGPLGSPAVTCYFWPVAD